MNAVVAVCEDWGIGNEGQLLVRNRADMRRFVSLTTGGTVVMGRKTYESLPGKRPLKNRRNIILTHDEGLSPEGFEVVHSVADLEAAIAASDPETVWNMGGASVYELLLPLCDRVEVTLNGCVRPADAFFPNLDEDPAWKVIASEPQGETDEGIPYCFRTYRRV